MLKVKLFVLCVMINSIKGIPVDILRERVQRIELRLTEDIDMVRQELYAVLKTVKESTSSKQGNNLETDKGAMKLGSSGITSALQMTDLELTAKIDALKRGFEGEKRIVRSVQDKVDDMLSCSRDLQNMLDKFMKNISIEFSHTNKQNIEETLTHNQEELLKVLKNIEANTKHGNVKQRYTDCSDYRRHGHVTSGIYTIYPDTVWHPLQVFCDMETDGGGWTVFQRRMDGSENFDRPWMDYAYGFGNLIGEFWLGNEFVYRLVSHSPHELRVELEDFENDRRVAEYGVFNIGNSSDLYRLTVDYFSGNVTDNLKLSHDGHQFSTRDRGPSSRCSASFKGGFWYASCHAVNINGLYLKGEHESYADGINWHGFRGYHYSLKFTAMKFRPK